MTVMVGVQGEVQRREKRKSQRERRERERKGYTHESNWEYYDNGQHRLNEFVAA